MSSPRAHENPNFNPTENSFAFDTLARLDSTTTGDHEVTLQTRVKDKQMRTGAPGALRTELGIDA